MSSRYFSFFGAVETAPNPPKGWVEVVEMYHASLPWLGCEACQHWNEAGHECRRGRRLCPASVDTLLRRALRGGGRVVDLGTDGAVEAVAVVRPKAHHALLVVFSQLAGWADVGVVRWPLEFTAPAAIAGACCAPRYGL